jgi:hypothetical protein
MPPRWLGFAIVVFWLATSAVFFYHEYWPYLEPGAPPPFAVDLVDEVRNPVPILWKVSYEGKSAFLAKTHVEHDAKANVFILKADFTPDPPQSSGPTVFGLSVKRLSSSYRVTPEGQLLGLDASVDAVYKSPIAVVNQPGEVAGAAQLTGAVANGRFNGTYEVAVEGITLKSVTISVPVSAQGSILIPLHPVNHLRGLRRGQTWRVPVVDPLDELLAGLVSGSRPDPTFLSAHVLAKTEMHTWSNKQWECLVIEYHGDEINARTLVTVEDDLVLLQEVTKSGATMTLQRE